jgi:hypothetical protein
VCFQLSHSCNGAVLLFFFEIDIYVGFSANTTPFIIVLYLFIVLNISMRGSFSYYKYSA